MMPKNPKGKKIEVVTQKKSVVAKNQNITEVAKKPNIVTRCAPKAVIDAAKLLSKPALDYVKDTLKFSSLLELKLESLRRRDFVWLLFHKTEVEKEPYRIRLSVGKKSFEITPDTVFEYLDLPRGSQEAFVEPASDDAYFEFCCLLESKLPKMWAVLLEKAKADNPDFVEDEEGEEEDDEIDYEEVKLQKKKKMMKQVRIGANVIHELLIKCKDDTDTQVRLFLLVLLNSLLMARSGFYVTEKQVSFAWDLEQA